ncbi:hypothetical protein FNF31_02076 [Cafeteria roenbergensis]|uniref:Uncharacterized protein n=3 Tax=Cafeteria roenbergensis TaxID=33653 RepID=A0A5A8DHS1_CAFRO|nr:hypothetical protein FNF31_02076 [Cafeteria roenbergensis]KAA0170164.1 hypothetical protein FNF28_01585 [Cafeteria roenbergensis]
MDGFSKGVVKQVLSGDTLVVMGTTGRIPAEMQISLSSLQAPRIARHPDATDEAWAFASREFLRELTIGKVVMFRVDYKRSTQSGAERVFGTVLLPQPVGSVARAVVAAGWARVVRVRGDDQPRSPDYDELVSLSEGAEAAAKGVFNPDTSSPDVVRDVTWDVADPEEALKTLRKAPQTAIIEGVRDGASIRCLLRPSNTMVNFNLAGVQAPRLARRARPAAAAAASAASAASAADRTKDEPCAAESRLFTERRLLGREVPLEFGGVDSFGNFFGRVLHPKGDIGVELLKAGMAQVNSRSVSMAPSGQVLELRSAEKVAKDARLGVWQAYAPRSTAGAKSFQARVIEVASGDSFTVAVGKGAAAVEERLFLASTRAPRMGRRGETPAPGAIEAQDMLRRILIGKEVDVRVCYTRDGGAAGMGPRKFVSVKAVNSKGASVDVALFLVTEGLAEVIKHRPDEDRADAFDAMLVAEASAAEAGRGIHKPATKSGKRDSKPRPIVDLSADSTKSRAQFPFLQRAHTMAGVVDHTFGGGRVKVTVPSQNVSFILALSGVRCPSQARGAATGRDGKHMPERAAEPFGNEAAAFMRQEVNHRDVEVQVEACDQRGNMLGQVWAHIDGTRRLLGAELLARGLAQTIPGAVDRSPYKVELYEAEEGARAARMGVWEGYVEAKEAEAKAEAGEEPLFTATAIDVVDGHTFFAHATRDAAALTRVNASMADLSSKAGTSGAAVDTAKGALVAALFDDGSGPAWFRARIEAKASASKAAEMPATAGVASSARDGAQAFRVTYVDFGNEAVVTTSELRPVPAAVTSVAPLARKCRLAFVRAKAPHADDFAHAAAVELSGLILGREVTMRVHGRDTDNSLLVSAFRAGDTESIAETLLGHGLIRISKTGLRAVRKRAAAGAPGADTDLQIVEALLAAQERARSGRIAQWHLGDIADSDDEPIA